MFCSLQSHTIKKAFRLLPCQKEQLGKRERIPIQLMTFSANSCNIQKLSQTGAKLQAVQSWCKAPKVSTTWCKAPQSAITVQLLAALCFAQLQLMRLSWLHTWVLYFVSEYRQFICKRWQNHFMCMSAGDLKHYGQSEALPVILQLLENSLALIGMYLVIPGLWSAHFKPH